MIVVNFDGACEPINPGGVAAYGVVIVDDDGDTMFEASEVFLPKKGHEKETSNNVAEYSGLLCALTWLHEKGYNQREILVRGDSKLVIYQNWAGQQYKKKWRVKKGMYVPICKKVQKMLKNFSNIHGKWIPREENGIADELSKAELIRAGVVFKIQPRKDDL